MRRTPTTGTDGATDPEYKTYQFAVDATFKLMGFSILGEYVGRWLDYEKTPMAVDPDIISGSNTYAHGFNVQGGYFLTEFLEATARCSVVYGNEGFNDGTAVEAGPGFNWFINGHKIKLQNTPQLSLCQLTVGRTLASGKSFSWTGSSVVLSAGARSTPPP